ncbi:MAG: BamA/TamA family outer membrane protein [Balneolaceae bacterium]
MTKPVSFRAILRPCGKALLPLWILAITFTTSTAQNTPQQDQEEVEKVVRIIRFTGNDHIRNRTLRDLIRSSTNREMLGIRRFTPWYYIYQLTGRFGESPVLLDRSMVSNDMERIRLYYENSGFFETEVDTSIVEYRRNRIELTFMIDEGPRTRIRSVGYSGLPGIGGATGDREFLNNNPFGRDMVNDSTFAASEPYNAQKLRSEQTRIIDYLRNNGYASVQRDSINALVKPDPEDQRMLDVLFLIDSGETYNFGDLEIRLSGPTDPEGGYDENRSYSGAPYTTEGRQMTIYKQEDAQTRFSLLTDQIRFRPGDTFNNSLYLRTVNDFQNLGMLTIRRFGLSDDGALPDYNDREIPVYFELQTLPKHAIRTELFGMRRYGFGTGVGVNYSNNNAFGRAENLTIGLNTNIEYVTSSDITSENTLFNSYQARIDYSLPRLTFPFANLDGHPAFVSGRTRYSLTYGQSNQPFFDINTDIRFNLRYEVEHGSRFTSFLDLVELDIIDTDPSSTYLTSLRNQFIRDGEDAGDPAVIERIENLFEYQSILEDFRPQFSSIIRYTFRSMDTDIIKRNFGHFSEFSVAIGGNAPYLMDRYLFSNGEVKGTLPSPLGLSGNSLGYSQFLKLSADYRRYIPVAQDGVFAFRGFAGYARPYNKSQSVPLNRRFFAGGSNDIRGWAPFRLGPGGIAPENVSINGGEIKLAAYTELRGIMFDNLLSADWLLAWHTDAGNIWYGRQIQFTDEDDVDLLERGKFSFDTFYKQIAVSSGLGLRLDWDYLILRLDFSYRVHDLQQGWFNNRQTYFSFGIGHSF